MLEYVFATHTAAQTYENDKYYDFDFYIHFFIESLILE